MQNENEIFYTIEKSYGPEEIKEKGSRFISYLYPVATVDEAEAQIIRLRKKYYDSTHVCFAYRIGNGKDEYSRFSDDGEPGGTAGVPILNEIKSKQYFNVLAAVVRYYGGTKLGTGGLVRAYGGSAKKVIDPSQPVIVYRKKEAFLHFPYEFTGEIMQIINRFSLDIIDREYTEKGNRIHLAIPASRVDEITRAISDASSGKIHLDCPGQDINIKK